MVGEGWQKPEKALSGEGQGARNEPGIQLLAGSSERRVQPIPALAGSLKQPAALAWYRYSGLGSIKERARLALRKFSTQGLPYLQKTKTPPGRNHPAALLIKLAMT